MRNFFLYKKVCLLCICLLNACTITGQEEEIFFDEHWKKAQTHFAEEQLTELWETLNILQQLTPDKKSVRYGKVKYLLGEYWYAKENWQKAKSHLDRAIPLLEMDTSERLILAEAYLVAGFTAEELKDEDQTLFYYYKALHLKQQIFGTVHPRVASIYFNIGESYYAKLDLIKSDSAFQKGVSILQTFYPEGNVELADYYEELGFNQSTRNNFKAAITYLEKALFIKEKELAKSDYSLFYSYRYLGTTYSNAEYFGESINYFQKALAILKGQKKRRIFQEAMLNFDIGVSYFELGAFEKAFVYFDKAAKIDPSNLFITYATYRYRGIVASNKGMAVEANTYFNQSKNIAVKIKDNKDYLLEIYKSIAEHQLKINRLRPAITNTQIALNKGLVTYKNSPNKLFSLYLLLGKCHLALDDFTNALNFYSKANTVNGGTISKDFVNLKQLKNKVTLNLEYTNLYKKKYKKDNDLSILLKRDSLLSKTIELVDYIITTYQEKSTKENFIEEYHKVYKQAVETSYLLATITKNETYLKSAFNLAEKSKNLILLETLNKVNALESAIIPDSIIQKEQSLRIDITYLENKRFEESQQVIINENNTSLLNEQIFDLKEQYRVLLKRIESTYPDYYKLKFKPSFTSIAKIQQEILTDNQTVIEYFLGDDLIYVFLVKKEAFKVFTLPKNENLASKINLFRESIYTYRSAHTVAQRKLNKSMIATTNQLGFELYESLILPFQEELTKKIIIIADGALGYLPFDALITEPPPINHSINHLSYFMVKHMISYGHSVNWLKGLYNREKVIFSENFIGIAPLFKATAEKEAIADFRLGLGPLKHNQEEVINIKNSIGGKIVTGLAATRQAFLDYLKQGQILHLATHGKSDDEQGDYSYLAFAEPIDSTDNQFLYVKDLFNLRIPAELVVLSACETGLGEIKRGEGIVGIGKGFSYAGAKSMVTTLWRVSDNSTANFMPIFYKNLKAGQAKDEALWNAKKEFIKKHRATGHPFFWSGYVAYGNMDAIKFEHYNLPYCTSTIRNGLLVLGVILYLLFFIRKQMVG